MITDQHPLNKHMAIGLWGVPNAGKSTLVNRYLGFDLSAVTPKAQTTRNAFHCVVVKDRTELVIIDTPGLHRSGKEMNIRMTGQAQEYVESTDLILILIDLTQRLETQFDILSKFKRPDKVPVAVVYNKIDKVAAEMRGIMKEKSERLLKEYGLEEAPTYWISAQEAWGTEALLDDLCACAQGGPHHYPDGSVSNKNQRFFVSEYIREEAFKILEQELPYDGRDD
jgi:GTPase